MFYLTITKPYNLSDASIEILIMLLVAFILGYLLCYFILPTKKENNLDEAKSFEHQIKVLNERLNAANGDKVALKKSITIEYGTKLDKLKTKLDHARADLEKCLSSKADNTNLASLPKAALTVKKKPAKSK